MKSWQINKFNVRKKITEIGNELLSKTADNMPEKTVKALKYNALRKSDREKI